MTAGNGLQAQCLVRSGPAVFDSLNTNVGPTYLRTLSNSMGVSASSRRLAVRYNYGFVVYSVANPSTPALASVEDFLGQDGYPKAGDGQSRTGPIALSEDGQRVLVPWTDTAGIGTIAQAFGGGSFGPGGDYPPAGYNTQANVVAELGNPARYLGVTTTMQGLYVADVTGVVGGPGASVENGIRSERVTSLGTDIRDLQAVKVGGRSLVVGKGDARVVVIDVTNAGPSVPGLSSGFTWKEFSAAELGVPSGSELSTVAAAEHPTSHLLHILVQATKTTSPYGVTKVALSRIVPGAGGTASVEPVGSFTPSSDASIPQNGSLLLPFDSDVVAFVINRRSTTVGGGLKLRVHSSQDFSTNLAESIAPIMSPSAIATMVGFRSAGGNVHLYTAGNGVGHALSLDCSTAPSPATAVLTVESVPFGGGAATAVPDLGSVFIGDQLRIKPAFSPADNVKPLLDWRLDYDFHDGNAADSQTPSMRLIHADASQTLGPRLPPSELTLVGPCDPAQLPQAGPPPNVSTGDGCWTSVTTNGNYGVPLGTPDFSESALASQQLKIAFEVQNALNEGGSSVATHRITWKIPQQGLKSSSILSGGVLEDGSDGSPSTTGFRWYFAKVPVGETGEDVLTLEEGCDGPTCSPAFLQAGQTVAGLQRPGDYRYWVSVPYRGGFRTAECPGLDGNTCTGLSTKTVKVTDVVLSITAPTQLLVGTSTFNATSTSKKAGSVAPCPSTSSGFTYDICEVVSGACTEGTYVSAGLSVSNPFPASGSGTITIPTPAAGTRGLRIRYSYSTGGNCASPTVAQWPAGGGWAPVTVIQAVPSIRLRNSTDSADMPKSLGIVWELLTGQTVRAYAELNGVRDPHPPAGLAWSYRLASSSQETAIGTTQGASFSVATTGDYKLILRGYGADVEATFGVASTGGGGNGGGTGPPTVTSVTASNYSPSVGQTVSFSCNATAGGAAITSYDWTLENGVTRTTSSPSTSYAYASSGTKTFSCTANDDAGNSSSTRVNQLNVRASTTGSCTFDIKNSDGVRISYDSTDKLYYASSGQPLTFQAANVTGTASWNFGNGTLLSGNPAKYTYTNTGSTYQTYTVTLTATSCSTTANISIAPGTGLDFTVLDVSTNTAVVRTGNTFDARAGQLLRFTATGATGAVSWDFGDNTSPSTEATPEKTYAPLVDTSYTVKLTNGAKSKSYTVAVKGSTGAPLTGNYTFTYSDGTGVNRAAVQPNKAITFTGTDQATTYTWDFGDGSALASGSPKEHTFTRGGSFTVKLTVARTGVSGTVTLPVPLVFKVTAPPAPRLWVAAGMAYTDGGNSAQWQADLSIYNPGTQPFTLSLGFVSGNGWSGAQNVTWLQQAFFGGETKSYSNILKNFFKVAKGSWGVVLVRLDTETSVSPVIMSRTYNAANVEADGTFGLSVPAMSVAAGVNTQSAGASNFLVDLRHDTSFRTNLTVANLKNETAEVEVIFRDAGGKVLGVSGKVTVEAFGVKQLDAALPAAPATGDTPVGGAGWASPASHFTAEVKLKRGTGVYPYATVIDQGTGDSIVVTPTARPSTTYRLPGIVRVKGKTGNYWVSDVAILNPGASARKILVTYSYVKAGATRRTESKDVITLAPHQLAVAVDFVRSWLDLAENDPDGYASSYVDFEPAPDDPAPLEHFVVTGKTYSPSGAGSVGLQVDAFVLEDGMSVSGSRRKLVLSGLEANTKFRTNVALFLTPGSTGSVQVDVHVLDSFGRESKKAFVGLDANTNPFVQLSSADLFSGLTTDESSRATVVIDTPRGTGYLGAYATVIDNLSEDATFVAGQPAP